ncbi:MAG: hypothetical protein U0U46_12580 [Saprospiraceae bacterium]
MRTLVAFLLFCSPLCVAAQEPSSSDATVVTPPAGIDTFDFDFWGSTLWDMDRAVQQLRDPLSNRLLAVRRRFANGNVSDEYLRVEDRNWLFLAYDSIEPARLIARGLYAAPPDYWLVDTSVTFDPESYDETYYLRFAPASSKSGAWMEEDSLGFIWTGEYEDGERVGLWERSNRRDPQYDLRGYIYEDGEIDRDTLLNLALATDPEAIVPVLCAGEVPGQPGGMVEQTTSGGLWRLCSVVGETPTRTTWTLVSADYAGEQTCLMQTWGSYLFLPDRTLIWGLPDRHGTTREVGHWEILDGNQILFSLPKQGEKWFRLKYLRDGELIMEELKN